MTGDIETGPSEPSPAATARGHRGEEIIPEGSNSEGHPENEKEEIPRTRMGARCPYTKFLPASLKSVGKPLILKWSSLGHGTATREANRNLRAPSICI
ncbi:hypothetical protein ACFXTN_012624 [Malus domestica]